MIRFIRYITKWAWKPEIEAKKRTIILESTASDYLKLELPLERQAFWLGAKSTAQHILGTQSLDAVFAAQKITPDIWGKKLITHP